MRSYHRQLLGRVALLEGGLCVVAVLWAIFGRIPIQQALTPVFPYVWLGIGLGAALLLLNVMTLEYGARYFAWCQRIKQMIEYEIAPLFRGISVSGAFMLAVISGISEEVFFRGVLQEQFGLIVASLIFGVAHVWRKNAIWYGLYAVLIGGLLGGVYASTRNLWAPVVAHMLNNFIAILYYRRLPSLVQPHESCSEKVTL
jgi:membrane protease YdiL (CAAX protease family)